MANPRYDLEFYEDAAGASPVYRWFMDELDRAGRTMLGMLLLKVLQEHGAGVAAVHWGKNLGQGLYEFRTRHTPEEVLKRFQLRPRRKVAKGLSGRLTLRVFFHVHGDKAVLLLSAYDKGRHPAKSEQQRQIKLARARLADWQRRASRQG
jgi:hypothetical protein